MKFSSPRLTAATMMIVVFAATAFSQTKTPLPTNGNMTAQEKKNLQFVLDWWREVIQARHVELIDKYAEPNLIQHNPNFGNGTAALKQLFGQRGAVNPIPPTLMTLPEIQLSQGNIVLLVWGHDVPDPSDPSKMYHYTSFDGFRIENNKIVEHWDSAMKNAPNVGRGGERGARGEGRGGRQ